MRGLKILSSVSFVLLCSASTVGAMNLSAAPQHEKPPVHSVQKIGWDQKNIQAQTEGAVFLRAQIEELTKQNEQLLNTLSQMRHDSNNKSAYTPGMEYETRIQALVEENKRLTKLVYKNQSQTQQKDDSSTNAYAIEIHKLKTENEELQKNISKLSGNSNSSVSSTILNELENYKKENASLRKALVNKQMFDKNDDKQSEQIISSLQKENRDLALALASATEETLKYQKKANGLRVESKASENEIVSELQSKIKTLTAQNESLQSAAEATKQQSGSAAILALKNQNESLRKTIKAQSETLISTSNASQTAERLIGENLMLKRKLEQAGKSSDFNGQTAKQLFDENKDLRNKLASLESNVLLLEDEKNRLMEEVKGANSQLTQAQTSYYNKGSTKVEMTDVSRSLQQALEKERATTIAYRTKIREYQDQLESLKNGSGNSDFENKINELTKENDGLKEEISKLSEQVSVSKKSAVYAKIDKIPQDDVTYIDAPYPPVQQVLPLLDENGNHIQHDNAEDNIAAEDLLSQGPKPLSE